MRFYLLIAAVFTVTTAQQYTTPVPILKQINKHNEDGSYSYGYEAADGTYKIETKYPDGQVFGKYGYIDDQGKLRTVEYGASRRGFEPAGNEIQVPPPTLKSTNQYARPLGPEEEDDGQYREDPAVYYKNDPYARSNNNNNRYPQSIYKQLPFDPKPVYTPQQAYNPRPAYDSRSTFDSRFDFDPEPTYAPAYRPHSSYRPQNSYRPQPSYQPSYQPAYQPAYQPTHQPPAFRPQSNFGFSSQPNYYNPPAPPAYPNYHPFQGHPATNVDITSGSYSVNYRK